MKEVKPNWYHIVEKEVGYDPDDEVHYIFDCDDSVKDPKNTIASIKDSFYIKSNSTLEITSAVVKEYETRDLSLIMIDTRGKDVNECLDCLQFLLNPRFGREEDDEDFVPVIFLLTSNIPLPFLVEDIALTCHLPAEDVEN
uniref:Uncharacterized protein n=1 Tax=viral metagenome TaxID=1070528 RepID=A0A6C0JTP0_9ZZZZ